MKWTWLTGQRCVLYCPAEGPLQPTVGGDPIKSQVQRGVNTPKHEITYKDLKGETVNPQR